MNKLVERIVNGLNGEIVVPADKSISHRAVILASLAKGKSIIKNFSKGQDPISSINICKSLGINAEISETELIIHSTGKLSAPTSYLDCGNSGTTMRFMTGILAGQNFNSVLIGDESLSKRPMKRVIEPLTLMGAEIKSKEYKAPLEIFGKNLHNIEYKSPLSSAQVKSCILLAGLQCDGITKFSEPYISRDHTERMLKYMGANISTDGNILTITKSDLEPKTIEVCGDISSAAFFIVAALIVPNSKIILKNVGLNPTRTGILEVVKAMGGNIEILDKKEISGEPVGDIKVEYSELKSCTIEGEIIPKLIDEIPVIAVLATQANGTTIIKDAQDLRNKESDRIKATVTELKKLGADIEETPDGFIINGKKELKGGCDVETYHDHRLAMSLYVAGLICEKPVLINGFEWVNISFPEFDDLFNNLKA
ncbi:3-phosphoshikimate 1-carboxyvinyltransferase [bacterium]|nr:3-phosphoshikimate 1-carboxyvinyltransferase [bacterium]